MTFNARSAEFFQLAALLLAVVLFYLVVIPAGVTDPEGFGIDEGLPPSFSPRLVAWMAMALMVVRAATLLLFGDPTSPGADPADVPGPERQGDGDLSTRAVIGVVLALVYSLALVPHLGFVTGSLLLMPALLLAMGERRFVPLTIYPAIVVLAVWALFEQLLAIRLPPAALFTS